MIFKIGKMLLFPGRWLFDTFPNLINCSDDTISRISCGSVT